MHNSSSYKKQLAYLAVVLVSFQVCYGLQILLPTNINWIMAAYHDWGQHYLGWAYFRQEPWGFPLGEINNFYYPLGTNIGFTDSIPLMALIFKVFGGLLPENFQYLGLWLFICHLFAAYYTVRILEYYKVNFAFTLLSVILVTVNPVLVFRALHPALCAHFLILASIYHYLVKTTKENSKSLNNKQMVVLVLAASINPYITAMVAGFNIILPLKHYFFDRSVSVKQLIMYPLLSFASCLLVWFLIGMVTFDGGSATNLASVDNFRIFSFNLNSFFNSYGYFSKILPDFGMYNEKQYEGFGYFGFGMLCLLLLIALYLLFRIKAGLGRLKKNKYIIPLLLLCLGLFLFAASCQLTFGKQVLFEYPVPNFIEHLGFIFRASGRFVWPLYYLIFLAALLSLYKIKIGGRYKTYLLLLLTLVQLYDIQGLLTKNNFTPGNYHTKLSDEKLLPVFKQFDQIITYPCFNTSLLYPLDYQDFCYLALKAGKPITNGYVARDKPIEAQVYRDSLTSRMNRAEIKNELFITTPANLEDFTVLLKTNKATAKTLDGLVYIYSAKKKLDQYFSQNPNEMKQLEQQIAGLGSQDDYTIDNFKPVESNAIQYNFDGYTFANSVLRIVGWACLKDTQNAAGDNIFIVISNAKSTLKVPVIPVKRPDVTAAQNRGNLDDSGFKALVFANVLDSGAYDLWLLIEDKNGVKNATKTDKKLWLDMPKQPLVKSRPENLKAVSSVELVNLNAFSPIKPQGNGGLVFLENSSTKSEKFFLRKGNYKLIIEGISYPEKPLKGVNAHFVVKSNGKKMGDFYLPASAGAKSISVPFSLDSDQPFQFELAFDNDEMVGDSDRNARITKISIQPD